MANLQVTTTKSIQTIEEFRKRLRGQLLRPGEAGYDETRTIHNGMIDRHPALIARCSGVADVMSCVNFAREEDLLVSVRGGGHGAPGHAVCDGGIMIDLSLMKSVRVDPVRRMARAEGGATWGDFDHETQAFGLATTGGIARPTGVAGLTLGGGHGFLMRRFGLACDNLTSVDIVTADGKLVTASSTQNSDLFWAVRGGGGNFGIVSSFEFQLYPLSQVLGGLLAYPLDRATEVFRLYREVTSTAPDELGTYAVLPSGKVAKWQTFLHAHWGEIAAADFFTTEVWTWRGLVTFYTVFVIHAAGRALAHAGRRRSVSSVDLRQGCEILPQVDAQSARCPALDDSVRDDNRPRTQSPHDGNGVGRVRRYQRFGGLLNYYTRAA